jgi:uncharacterized phage-associated protein
MATVHDIADYITMKLTEAGVPLNTLKLHKLLYYVQAWHLAFYGDRCFNSTFQAWVHGPVSRAIYDRFKDSKTMYSPVRLKDVRPEFALADLSEHERRHTDAILESYADFTDDQLESMTHDEEPWQKAREGYGPRERCEETIDDDEMKSYYRARLQ